MQIDNTLAATIAMIHQSGMLTFGISKTKVVYYQLAKGVDYLLLNY